MILKKDGTPVLEVKEGEEGSLAGSPKGTKAELQIARGQGMQAENIQKMKKRHDEKETDLNP